MKIQIYSASKKIYESDEVRYASLPGEDGTIGVLEDHEPIISTLGVGEIKISENGTDKYIAVLGGFVQIAKNEIFVLADEAQLEDDAVLREIEEAIERTQKQLDQDLPPQELIRLEKEIKYHKLRKEIGNN